jgi:hypothetical protein
MRLRRMGYVGNVAHMEEMNIAHKSLIGNTEEKTYHFKNLGIHDRMQNIFSKK